MKKTFAILFVLACNNSFVYSQVVNPLEFDYSYADSIALNFHNNSTESVSDLTEFLIKNVKSEHEKLRVLFRWVTDNIEYSYSNSTGDADIVLKKRKAVCEGYASLLKALCDEAGIECKIIHGYVKNEAKDIGVKMKETNHAWNIVKLYDEWYIIDATWASGYYKGKFTKAFNESYFLATPTFAIFTHFPEDSNYQFLDTPYKMKDFVKFPIAYTSDVMPIEKIGGIIKKDLFLKLTSKTVINKVSLAFAADKYERPVELDYKDGIYEITYMFKSTDKGEFTLFIDNKAAYTFIKK